MLNDNATAKPSLAPPVVRFAPSPNGLLHLGHARSAVLNTRFARSRGGSFLLRVEDIDTTRARPEFEAAIFEDLAWLGLEWPTPVRRQSEHLADYEAALTELRKLGLLYPAFLSRAEAADRVRAIDASGGSWPRDPDGVPHYPGDDRALSDRQRTERIDAGEPHAWRLDMQAAVQNLDGALHWDEHGAGPNGETGTLAANPAMWGDVKLARRDIPASYHLAVSVDDALQQVTDVIRGEDLFASTSVHRLLQHLLGLPSPRYHHHSLVCGSDGCKLSKRDGATSLASLRQQGATSDDILALAGLAQSA
ncbi:tRNA glutamyl-Q(34) synthetase GluQRS [Hoeflea sp. YIM 152468]|uniref:tRNA glutamyl-Q(34) synthetase GluQRS n=1 Tax=Hoeflea sp. YIM 152468 TaxID=3031759 RepID=UPI0023D9B2A0|nr:tRNA glutamyl-Q(34) synthetase GluQRS [Hoeflea sp. YIM 152468]MDF1608033.1 tRNA glutamyl-Q(34) synthetase GluQRS [Hoeflea sp. YIM 152468]